MAMAGERILRNKSQVKAIEAGKTVETVNCLKGDDFFAKYHTGPGKSALDDSLRKHGIISTVSDASTLDPQWLDLCFSLIEQTSRDDYQRSEAKWKPVSKRKEMLLPDMKYVVVHEATEASDDGTRDRLVGFVSFMITYEDGYEVIYVYELHCTPGWQGKGMGRVLMDVVESIGREVGVAKSMLTVFKTNERAVRWYHKLDYVVDEFSPAGKRLRNGTVKQPTYLILSKMLNNT